MEAEALFWTKVAAIGQVAGAAATFLAVVVSLYLARQSGRVRLSSVAGLRIVFMGDGSPAWDIIAIRIENLGDRTVRIANLGWRSGWLSWGPEWLRYRRAVQQFSYDSPKPPHDLPAGADVVFTIRLSDFSGPNSAEKNADLFGRKLPWKKRIIPAQVRVVVSAVGSKDLYFPVEKSLAAYLTYGDQRGGAAELNEAAAAREG